MFQTHTHSSYNLSEDTSINVMECKCDTEIDCLYSSALNTSAKIKQSEISFRNFFLVGVLGKRQGSLMKVRGPGELCLVLNSQCGRDPKVKFSNISHVHQRT